MTDTANAREIIAEEMPSIHGGSWLGQLGGADRIIASLAAAGLEIRPIAPPAGKDVFAGISDQAMREFFERRTPMEFELLKTRLIQQGLREAAGAFSRAFEEDIRCGWDVAPQRLLDFENDLARRAEMQDLRANNRRLIDEPYMSRQTARADAMGKGEE